MDRIAMPRLAVLFLALAAAVMAALPAQAEEPDLIFKKSTVFHLLTPDHKLATYGIDDPLIDGVACHFTVPEKGGLSGMFGVAEELSNASIACRQVGPVVFKEKFEQGEEMFRVRRSVFFKKMRIVRGCDTKRNVLVYLSYTDKLIEGSPENSTSTVPIMPWGDQPAPRCADFIDD
ncbi:MAG: CreA family protein [Rhodobiaceae bacterium]|nr:CreA family protein [Rhodobiaceae bacterium]MCC0053903.1 CreA family protein [Rhodobiaceae bacterium]